VFFQEKDDPQLFTKTPAERTVQDFNAPLAVRLGELRPPDTGFIGRAAGSCWPSSACFGANDTPWSRARGDSIPPATSAGFRNSL
jgi:hypothetical protein